MFFSPVVVLKGLLKPKPNNQFKQISAGQTRLIDPLLELAKA